MDYSQFVKPELLVLVAVIYVIGMFLKGTKYFPDELIPLILLVIAISICVFQIGFGVDAFIQGVLVTAAAVYGNQLIKQTKEVTNKDTDI